MLANFDTTRGRRAEFHNPHVKQDNMKRREEAQSGQRMKSWPHKVRVLTF